MQRNGGGYTSIDMSRIHDYFPTSQSKYCIRRVDNQLRTINEKAYEPEIIAIGPYHQGKNKFKKMEQQKLYYLDSLLKRRGKNVEEYFKAVKGLEDQARKFYAELPELTSDKFVEMLVLDGCFIVELFIRFDTRSTSDYSDDEIFQNERTLSCLKRDLFLFENQIPFFVLFELFNMIEVNKDFVELAIQFFEDQLPGVGYLAQYEGNRLEDTIHLLSLIHDNWLPTFAVQEPTARNQNNLNFIPPAATLREAGVMFEKADEKIDLLNIKFEGGKLQIPPLVIQDETECLLRNLIAYEQYYQYIGHCHIISYAKFLNCLIKSPENVDMLCGHRIIQSKLNNEAVSQIFNRINESIRDPGIYFHYSDVFSKVNHHCSKRRNRWMAKLCHDYLHSPWGVISIFAASLTFIFTSIQGICSVFSCK